MYRKIRRTYIKTLIIIFDVILENIPGVITFNLYHLILNLPHFLCRTLILRENKVA